MSENLLGAESSPYLLQHRDNPVHWRPWGPEALAEAKAADKAILLSVGYSACHWCHVMAHESFEDDETAQLMNGLFVNIKVDREERPDLDTIYQRALALMGQQGGWPLTMFLTPDAEPFWGGTYFPLEPRFGRPGFKDVLRLIEQTYRGDRDKVDKNRTALVEALQGLARSKPGEAVTEAQTENMARTLLREVDGRHGGIGGAPKFPQCSMLELLWRSYLRTGSLLMKTAVVLSMERMCQGGIYDHLGGGFARYSTDERWLAPHFEKMLYDNAQLLDLLCHVWQETGEPLFAARAAETVAWALREMRTGEGAFASALDADSEGEEGTFYVWSEAEIDELLGADAAYFKAVYDVTPGGNWEGKTILNRLLPPGTDETPDEPRLAGMRTILLERRASRERPGWDDKVLADWNGLMIAALATAGCVFGEQSWLDAAVEAFDYVAGPMAAGERLRHSARHGRSKDVEFLDDYAEMARAALMLAEATGDGAYLARAQGWVAVLDAHYWDEAEGGYFYTPDDGETSISRTKTAHDAATPAGNGTLVGVLRAPPLSHRRGGLSRPRRGAGEGVLRRAGAELLSLVDARQQQRGAAPRGAGGGLRRASGGGDESPHRRCLRNELAKPGAERAGAAGCASGRPPRRRQGAARGAGHGLRLRGPGLLPAGDRTAGAAGRARRGRRRAGRRLKLMTATRLHHREPRRPAHDHRRGRRGHGGRLRLWRRTPPEHRRADRGRRPAHRIFRRCTPRIRAAPRAPRDALPPPSVGGDAGHSLRRNPELR